MRLHVAFSMMDCILAWLSPEVNPGLGPPIEIDG